QNTAVALRLFDELVQVLALVEGGHDAARAQHAKALADPVYVRPFIPREGTPNVRRWSELARPPRDRRVTLQAIRRISDDELHHPRRCVPERLRDDLQAHGLACETTAESVPKVMRPKAAGDRSDRLCQRERSPDTRCRIALTQGIHEDVLTFLRAPRLASQQR